MAQLLNYDVIYSYDNIYYITGNNTNKIIPVLLEFKAYESKCCKNNNIKNYHDLLTQIKYYNTSIPFDIFVSLNIPDNYDSIKLKYLSQGKINEKHIIINDYKKYLIYNLFDN